LFPLIDGRSLDGDSRRAIADHRSLEKLVDQLAPRHRPICSRVLHALRGHIRARNELFQVSAAAAQTALSAVERDDARAVRCCL